MNPVWRYLRIALAVIVLLGLSISGFWGVGQEWKYAASLAEKSSTFMQTAYAVLGLVAVPMLLMQLRGLRPLLYAWAGCLVLTGATAPVIWGGMGWWPGFFAACLMGVVSGLVIWLAPLPQSQRRFRLWRWLLAGLFAVATVVVLSAVVRMAPGVIHSRKMEAFCEGLPGSLDQKGLTDMVQQQGYIATPGKDEKGAFLKITSDDPAGTLSYACEARFKPDGSLASVNFTAGAKD